MGARTVGQFVAALGNATSAYLLAVGHLLRRRHSTRWSGYGATAVSRILSRAVASVFGWLWALPSRVGLENKAVPLLLALAIGVGLLLDRIGGLAVIRSPWLWGGVAIAVVAWLPWLVWQAGTAGPSSSSPAMIRDRERKGRNAEFRCSSCS
jgi:hypothetical protein